MKKLFIAALTLTTGIFFKPEAMATPEVLSQIFLFCNMTGSEEIYFLGTGEKETTNFQGSATVKIEKLRTTSVRDANENFEWTVARVGEIGSPFWAIMEDRDGKAISQSEYRFAESDRENLSQRESLVINRITGLITYYNLFTVTGLTRRETTFYGSCEEKTKNKF